MTGGSHYTPVVNRCETTYSRLSLSRTRKGPVNLFEIEKVRDREKVLKIRKKCENKMTKD